MAIADYPYSFASQPIIDPTTGQPVLNATGGVLQDPASGALLSMADMNGNPITQITGNAYGMSQQFRSTQLAVLVKFGSVYVQAPSIEMFNLVQTTADAVALAQSAQALASAAAAAAQTAAAQVAGGGGSGVTVHAALSGLGADDHTQYHNDARGDARYYLKSLVDSAIAAAVSTSSTADRNRANHSGTQLASSISDFNSAVVAAGGGGGGGGGVTVHGALSGLLADDHTQYLTNTRGDARYYTQAQVDAKDTAAASASSAADRDRTNHTGVQSIGSVSNLQATLDAKRDSFDAAMVGPLAVTVGGLRKRLPAACTLDSVTVAVGTAPAGAAVIVDVKKNGVTIFGTAANRPTIAAGTNGVTVAATAASVTTFAAGDYLTVDVAQVGSTTAGADLVASVWVRF